MERSLEGERCLISLRLDFQVWLGDGDGESHRPLP